MTDEPNEVAASSSAGQNNELPSNATTLDSTTKLVSHATRHQDHMAVDESDEEEEEEFISGEKNIVYITLFDNYLIFYDSLLQNED